MKRYIYHYTCLALALFQLIVVIETIGFIIEDYSINGVDQSLIAGIIACYLLMFVICIVEKFLRGYQNNNFFVDCLLLTLVSPIRFICELITIIRLHILRANGDYDFGERGGSSIYYLVFNAKAGAYVSTKKYKPVSKTSSNTKKPKKNKKPTSEERHALYNKFVAELDREYEEANVFLHNRRRNDKRYNVFIVPLCSVDKEKLFPFSVQNDDYHGERYITELYINDKKIIYEVGHSNTVAFSLEPGNYDFKVVVKGNVKPSTYSESNSKVNKTFQLKNVYVGENEDVHLAIVMIYGSVFTRYTERYTGKFIRDEFEYFSKNFYFNKVQLSFLNELCGFWMAHQSNIDRAVTGYGINKDRSQNKK